jgi:NUMOD4 motif/HNH endonuclease
MDEELWRPIPHVKGYYEVSNKGRVRSLDRVVVSTTGAAYPRAGRVLNIAADTNGYKSVVITVLHLGVRGRLRVHRAVAEAFCERYDGCTQVDHIDGDKANNNADNLRWCTALENIRHAVVRGSFSGASNPNRAKKFTEAQIKGMHGKSAAGATQRQIAAAFNTGQGTVSLILRGRVWASTAKNLHD